MKNNSENKNAVKLPTITLVTPSFNQAKFLEKTIVSVLSQEYPKLEYIVMDGGSVDGSVEIIKKYKNNLYYWQSGKDEGQGDAIINGWKMGRGEMIGWLNSDDVLMPDSLLRLGTLFSKGCYDVVTGETLCIDENDIISAYMLMWKGPLWMYRAALLHPGQPGTFYSRNTVERVDYFDKRLFCAMEFDLVMKMLKSGATIGSVPSAVAALRHHSETKSKQSAQIFLDENRRIFGEHATFPFNYGRLREFTVKLMKYPYALRYLKPSLFPETRKKITWLLKPTRLPLSVNYTPR